MRGLYRTWSAAWQEALANRRGFATQVVIMLVNDLMFVVFWFLFFREVGEVRGWGIDQLMVLYAVFAVSAGFVLGAFNNVRHLGALASSGGLDALLALPSSPLLHLLFRRVATVNVGDIFFGFGLFLWLGQPTLHRFVVFVFGAICAIVILTSFMIIVGSLNFFIGRSEASELGIHSILLFANYPGDLFGGTTRLFLYAVVPAGFVSTVPARLVDDFDPLWALGTVAFAGGLAFASWVLFTLGLRR